MNFNDRNSSAYTEAKKNNKQNRFQELHHLKDHQLVKFVKNYFYLDFAALPRAFEEQAQ